MLEWRSLEMAQMGIWIYGCQAGGCRFVQRLTFDCHTSGIKSNLMLWTPWAQSGRTLESLNNTANSQCQPLCIGYVPLISLSRKDRLYYTKTQIEISGEVHSIHNWRGFFLLEDASVQGRARSWSGQKRIIHFTERPALFVKPTIFC